MMSMSLITNPAAIHANLKILAPGWLAQCGLTSDASFGTWVLTRKPFILNFEWGFVFVVDYVPGLKATLHPLIVRRPGASGCPPTRADIVSVFDTLNVERLSIEVLPSASKGVTRALKRSGWQLEGTLRGWSRNEVGQLLDVELWSILKYELESKEVQDGRIV